MRLSDFEMELLESIGNRETDKVQSFFKDNNAFDSNFLSYALKHAICYSNIAIIKFLLNKVADIEVDYLILCLLSAFDLEVFDLLYTRYSGLLIGHGKENEIKQYRADQDRFLEAVKSNKIEIFNSFCKASTRDFFCQEFRASYFQAFDICVSNGNVDIFKKLMQMVHFDLFNFELFTDSILTGKENCFAEKNYIYHFSCNLMNLVASVNNNDFASVENILKTKSEYNDYFMVQSIILRTALLNGYYSIVRLLLTYFNKLDDRVIIDLTLYYSKDSKELLSTDKAVEEFSVWLEDWVAYRVLLIHKSDMDIQFLLFKRFSHYKDVFDYIIRKWNFDLAIRILNSGEDLDCNVPYDLNGLLFYLYLIYFYIKQSICALLSCFNVTCNIGVFKSPSFSSNSNAELRQSPARAGLQENSMDNNDVNNGLKL